MLFWCYGDQILWLQLVNVAENTQNDIVMKCIYIGLFVFYCEMKSDFLVCSCRNFICRMLICCIVQVMHQCDYILTIYISWTK